MDPKKIRSIIIDDDPFIHDLLQDKLNQYLPEVEVVATASSGSEGIQEIAHHQPDLIFLDVEMADMTGFEMLSSLSDIRFQTIFITSYSHYAIKAIRFNALDYLIKPFDLGELKHAIKRYKSNVQDAKPADKVQQALANLNTKEVADQKLILQTQEGELRLPLKDIVRVEGERNYSYIYLANSKKKIVAKTLGDFEELLNEKGFFRCHKSYLVNRAHISADPTSFSLFLSDGTEIPIARRKKEAFKQWFSTGKYHDTAM